MSIYRKEIIQHWMRRTAVDALMRIQSSIYARGCRLPCRDVWSAQGRPNELSKDLLNS